MGERETEVDRERMLWLNAGKFSLMSIVFKGWGGGHHPEQLGPLPLMLLLRQGKHADLFKERILVGQTHSCIT